MAVSYKEGMRTIKFMKKRPNRPFPSWGFPLCPNESSSKTIHMTSAKKLIFVQIKLIFKRKGFARGLIFKQRHKVTRK